MKRRKLEIIIISVLILMLVLSGCGQDQVEEAQDLEVDEKEQGVRLAGLKGPTTIGLVKLIDRYEKENPDSKDSFTMYQNADEVAAGLSKGEIDIAAIPANLAATLYKKTEGEIKVAAINTLGVLYIVENGDRIEVAEDLQGRTIYSLGKGTTPEGVLNSFIEGYGLKDVRVEYKNDVSEIGALLKTEKNVVAMIPEPFVTLMEKEVNGLEIRFNMNNEWADLHGGDLQVTGVLVVRNDFLEENQLAFDKFLEDYERSIKYTMTNVEETAKLVEEAGIVPPGIGEKAIPRTNIVYIDGEDMEKYLSRYLTVLYNHNEKLVGGSLPDEDFYYKK